MSEIIQQRPNIAGLFQAGNVRGLTNHKHRRLFHSLQWRQAYQHSEFYEYTFEKETLPLETPPTIKVRQIPNGELKGLGTGTFVWPAAHILAKYFEKRFLDGSLTEKLICDIGSGTGITGFVAAILGAKVVLTDQHCILPLLSENTEALIAMDCFSSFSMADRLIVKEYEWENKTALMDHPFDYLIVSDCVLPKLYPISMLVNAIDFLMSDKTISFFSYEHRPFPEYDPRQVII
jgi:predicted nicotinamide N-methyase